MLAKFGQNAACRLRVKECDVQSLGALTWSLVDEANALLVTLCKCIGSAVLNAECHMVHSLVAFVEPLLDGAFRRCRLEKLKLCLATLQEGGLHFLVFNHFYCVTLQSRTFSK